MGKLREEAAACMSCGFVGGLSAGSRANRSSFCGTMPELPVRFTRT